jgi:hypothetical protein
MSKAGPEAGDGGRVCERLWPARAVVPAVPRKTPLPPPPRGSVLDALESLESRRRKASGKAQPKGRRGDLDLGSIP